VNTIVYYRGEFYAYDGCSWKPVEIQALRKEKYEWLSGAYYFDHNGELQPFKPTKSKIDNVLDALKATVFMPASIEPPTWIGPRRKEFPPASEFIPFQNGLLHIPTRRLYDPTPEFFTTYHLPYKFTHELQEPKTLLRILHDQWADDPESIETLQEAMGLLLTADVNLHKMFLLVGPPRAGKGLIASVIKAMVGEENYISPSLASLAGQFGMQPFIGKTVALIADARLGRQPNETLIVERMLNISGGDTVTIDRKYMETWTGKLPTRIVIMSNEVPRLNEASGALAGRFVILRFTRSFLGQEDTSLQSRLFEEVPSIISWALDGLDRLRARGEFRQPESGSDLAELLSESSSPVMSFVRNYCEIEPGLLIETKELYDAWVSWCHMIGRNPADDSTFGTDLRAAIPTVTRSRLRTGPNGTRVPHYVGIGLNEKGRALKYDGLSSVSEGVLLGTG